MEHCFYDKYNLNSASFYAKEYQTTDTVTFHSRAAVDSGTFYSYEWKLLLDNGV